MSSPLENIVRVASDASRSVSDGEGTAADANFILRRCDANLGKRLLQKGGTEGGEEGRLGIKAAAR